MTTPRLRVHELARPGLLCASFELDRGECVAVRGVSGSGKSLLLRAIADLDSASGRVLLDGEPRDAIPAPIWRRRVGYVPAESGWWAERVGDHFGAWEVAKPWVERMGLPGAIREWRVARLSTGERQRLALARALVLSPCVLLLDEPTSALDEHATRAVEGVVAAQRAGGCSVVWVTHDANQARRVGDRTLRVSAGSVREVEA